MNKDSKYWNIHKEVYMDEFDKLDKLICKYAYLKSQLNGKAPYEWEGFLPQLFGKEVGDGIPTPKKESGVDLPK